MHIISTKVPATRLSTVSGAHARRSEGSAAEKPEVISDSRRRKSINAPKRRGFA
jgi:hypothetical protein